MSTETRHIAMLSTAFGTIINNARHLPDVTEIIVNPDGQIWIEQNGVRAQVDETLPPEKAEQIVRLVASHVGKSCTAHTPIISAELPGGGERFEGLLPPAVKAPCFVIRRPASRVFTLQEYVDNLSLTQVQKLIIDHAISQKQNIIVAGGTGSGKTTFVNAILNEVSKTGDRLVVIEDTIELQCTATDHTSLRTIDGAVTMHDLVRSALRLRPDRIIIGEVRGAEALDLLKAWNTGHPGGVATIHANSAASVMGRLEQLVMEASQAMPQSLIAEAVDLILFISKTCEGRKVSEMLQVNGLTDYGEYDLSAPSPPAISLIANKEVV